MGPFLTEYMTPEPGAFDQDGEGTKRQQAGFSELPGAESAGAEDPGLPIWRCSWDGVPSAELWYASQWGRAALQPRFRSEGVAERPRDERRIELVRLLEPDSPGIAWRSSG